MQVIPFDQRFCDSATYKLCIIKEPTQSTEKNLLVPVTAPLKKIFLYLITKHRSSKNPKAI